MKVTTYLNFDGDCGPAFRFYAEVLGGTIGFMQTFGDSPMADELPADKRDHVVHARLDIGDQVLMGSDSPGQYEKPQGFGVSLGVTPDEAERIFPALADGGTVQMPLQETYWSKRFGVVTDRYGTPWIVNGEA